MIEIDFDKEHAAFEAWCATMSDMPTTRYAPGHGHASGHYMEQRTNWAWDAWSARAALDTAKPGANASDGEVNERG